MRNFICILSALFLVAGLCAQDVKQQVLSSAGGYSVAGDNSMSLSWTLGELIITKEESAGGGLVLTQGFHQSQLIVEGIDLNHELGVQVKVYPNPAWNFINLEFSEPLNGETTIFLSGPDGRLVNTQTLEPGNAVSEIALQALPPGTYFLRIKNGHKLNVYKIIKL